MYYPLGLTYDNKELIHTRTTILSGPFIKYWLPICWFGFFYLSLVMALFFASRKNRKFPACTLGWMLVFDWMYFLREIFRGSPIDAVSEALLWTPSQATCTALYLWLMWGDAASYIMSVFLCLFIYKIVVQKVNLKLEHKFFWKFIATFVTYTTLYTILIGIVASLDGFIVGGTGCAPRAHGAPILGVIQSSIIGSIQICLLLLILKYMIEVTKSAPNVVHSTRKKFFLLRFFLLVVCETFPRIYFNGFYLYFAYHRTAGTVPSLQALYTIVSMFYLLAGLVVLSNTFAWDWFIRRFISVKEIVAIQRSSQHSSLSNRDSSSSYKETKSEPITIVLENV